MTNVVNDVNYLLEYLNNLVGISCIAHFKTVLMKFN